MKKTLLFFEKDFIRRTNADGEDVPLLQQDSDSDEDWYRISYYC